jgi:hypothetical protein
MTTMGALLTLACEAMLHDATNDRLGEAALQRWSSWRMAALGRKRQRQRGTVVSAFLKAKPKPAISHTPPFNRGL